MLSENAVKMLKKKGYFQKNESKWEDICNRVSIAISDAEESESAKEKIKTEIYKSMCELEFIFSTPCLLNANIDNPGQLSSCFVLPIKDSIDNIFDCLKYFANIFQKNGGAGTNLSSIRPIKSNVETSGGYSSGTTGFMTGFDWVADELTKYNEARKGAVKLDLAIWHPDIFDFISIKHNTNKLQKMNISVALDDNFMKAVENGDDWDLIFPDFSWNKEIYNKEWNGNIYEWKDKGYPIKKYATVKANDLLDKIAYEAWFSGEPGISYQTTMNNGNKNKHLNLEVFGNPCHEFVNIPFSSCNLGSHNLPKYIKNNKFNFKKYGENLKKSIRWMDDMITVNKLPLKEIEKITKGIRPIGIGTMGFAHLLYSLGIKYNSEEAYEFADKLYKFSKEKTIEASQELAKERGTYPLFEGSEWQKEGINIRNSSVLSIAPNGTLAFIASTTGGTEPQYALVYSRRTDDGTLYYEIDPYFKQALNKKGLYSDELMAKIEKNHGSCQGIKEIPKDIQNIFVTSHDIPPEDHIKMTGIIQKYVDLSISKTVNFSNNATIEDIKNLIIFGHKNKCKGITVYRDGSRENQTLSASRDVEENKLDYIEPINRKRFGKVTGTTEYKNVACGKMYITVNKDKSNNIMEIIIAAGKHGICSANAETISRLVSGWLRAGISVKSLIKLLKGIKCPACLTAKGKGKSLDGISCSDTLGRCIEEAYGENYEIKMTTTKPKLKKEKKSENDCPECGQVLTPDGGCKSCANCGFSKCSG